MFRRYNQELKVIVAPGEQNSAVGRRRQETLVFIVSPIVLFVSNYRYMSPLLTNKNK